MRKLIAIICMLAIAMLANAQKNVRISDIQGGAYASPLDGDTVTTRGVVTGVTDAGFFVQSGDSLWGGLYVYGTTQALPGDSVCITGLVQEYMGMTQLCSTSETVVSCCNTMPNPVLVAAGEVSEPYEGMLVSVAEVKCSADTLENGEWMVNDGSNELRIDDEAYSYTPTVDSTYNVTGLVYFSFGNFKIEPRNAADISLVEQPAFTRFPLLTHIENKRLVIDWQTNTPTTSLVEWNRCDGGDTVKARTTDATRLHTLIMNGLQPATMYQVRITAQSFSKQTPVYTMTVCTQSESLGRIRSLFNHGNELTSDNATATPRIEDTIANIVCNATHTIDLAVSELASPVIIDAINDVVKNGVKVRCLTGMQTNMADNATLDSSVVVLRSSLYDGMSGNFVVIDADSTQKATVVTGSTNFAAAAPKRYNVTDKYGYGEDSFLMNFDDFFISDCKNVLIVEDQSLARVFVAKFDEMWENSGLQTDTLVSRFEQNSQYNLPSEFRIGDKRIGLLFSPAQQAKQAIMAFADSARTELLFATDACTNDTIARALINALRRGATVQGIMDNVYDANSQCNYLQNNGIDVNDCRSSDDCDALPHNAAFCHNYAIADHATVLVGSGAWTDNGCLQNNGSIVVIHDSLLALAFREEYMQHACNKKYYKAYPVSNGAGKYKPVSTLSKVERTTVDYETYDSFSFIENNQAYHALQPAYGGLPSYDPADFLPTVGYKVETYNDSANRCTNTTDSRQAVQSVEASALYLPTLAAATQPSRGENVSVIDVPPAGKINNGAVGKTNGITQKHLAAVGECCATGKCSCKGCAYNAHNDAAQSRFVKKPTSPPH